MNPEIAGLRVVFAGDTAGYDTASDKVKADLRRVEGMGSRITSVGDSLMSAGRGLMIATAPVALAFGSGVKTASDFESVMKEIQARAGLTGEEMQRVSDFALKMGADTQFSGLQAGQALLELMSSGQSVEQAMGTLPAVMEGAAAGAMDLGNAGDLVTDVMAMFGLSVADSYKIMDTLSRGAAASSATMGDLGAGLANVGSVAKNAGMSFEDTIAALAVLAENGIKGAEGGTALKSMLLNMKRPVEDVGKTWDKLGIKLYDATGKIRPFTTVLKELNAVLPGLTDQDRDIAMQTLAGSYGILASSALTGALSVDTMKQQMSQQASVSEIAAMRMDTFAGTMESLAGSFEALQTRALTPFMDNVLKPMVNELIPIVNNITAWTQANPELTGTIIKVAGAALVAGPAFMVLGSVVKGVGVAMNVAFGPVGILLGAIGVGLVFINEKFGSLENAINLARTAAGQLGFLMWKALTDASGAAGELVGKITGGLTIAVQDLGVTVRRMAGGIGIAFTDVGNALGQLFWNLGNSVGSFITARIVTAMQAYGLLAYLMGDGQKMVEIAKQIEQIQKPMGPYVPTPYADWMVGYANEQYQGRAMGGGVSAGQPYMVGERGPELFVPGRTGMIVPNRALGGSGGGVINLHVVLRGENFEDHIYERVAVALR